MLDRLSHRINQFTTSHFSRLNAFANDLFCMERPAPLHISHHSLPFLQILLYQPIDQALDLVFDLLWYINQHAFLEFSPNFIATHQLLDLGQSDRRVKKLETALLESMQ